jgi:hypothetical protein
VRWLTRKEWGAWWVLTLGIPLGVYAVQLALLCIRFGQLPNYWESYNWPENLVRIIRSTPSLSDIVRIGSDEWLFEVGRKSVVYGLTVVEWRLAVEPAKVLLLGLVSVIAATNWVLSRREIPVCSVKRTAGALTASGTAVTSLTAVSISWVACCGVPSWVTGLTILGLNYSTALMLQPFGTLMAASGIASLLAGTALLTRVSSRGRTVVIPTS